MARYLVVANQTLGGDHLMTELKERVAKGDCEVHVLVPATPEPGTLVGDEAGDVAAAQHRLDDAMTRFGGLGCKVTGEIGDVRPVEAIGDTMRREPPFDEIILSTLPPGLSKWLGLDLPSRVGRAYDLPITHVTAPH